MKFSNLTGALTGAVALAVGACSVDIKRTAGIDEFVCFKQDGHIRLLSRGGTTFEPEKISDLGNGTCILEGEVFVLKADKEAARQYFLKPPIARPSDYTYTPASG